MKEIKFNNRTIRFRKWKVKDKKLLDSCKSEIEKRKVYVYNCLENPNEALDLEEFNYVLANIRDYSLSKPLEYEVTCSCGETLDVTMLASEIVTAKNADYTPIAFGDVIIELCNVRDQNLYEETVLGAVTMSERYISDFAMHIKSINSSDVDYKEAIEFIENLDVDVYENIFKKWEIQRFKCSFEHSVTCKKCHKETVYNFEDMKDFYPSTWNL